MNTLTAPSGAGAYSSIGADRIEYAPLREKITGAAEAAALIKSDMTIALGGFSAGFPKVVPYELIKLGKARGLTLLCGAALGPEMFGALALSGQISRYAGYFFDNTLRAEVDAGRIEYRDLHLGQFPDKIERGEFGRVGVSVIECTKINADGGIVPSVSIGPNDVLFRCSDKVILELNTSLPVALEGFHDISSPRDTVVDSPAQIVGESVYRCDPEKIAAIVITDEPELRWDAIPFTELHRKMARNVVDVIKNDIADGRLDPRPTLQVGAGDVANAVLNFLSEEGLHDLDMFTEVFATSAARGLRDGLFRQVSTTCLDCGNCCDVVFEDLEKYRGRLVIRPMGMSNSVANIISMGLVSMNTAVEADIYGNVNSTNVSGSHMIYGIGGAGDFARNAKLTIFITPSTAKGGRISSIVPMCAHVDNTEHDVDVIVTEWGAADLRGLSPRERASVVIENCAHPDYRQQLRNYYNDALELCGPVQTPHDFRQSLSWYQRYAETGTMRES